MRRFSPFLQETMDTVGTHFTSVLLADPDADTRSLYREAFTMQGWRCREAADGREALVAALTAPPALCIAEVRLPLIDGIALCRELRQDPQTSTLPILLVTAETRTEHLDEAARAGASGVLVKPASIETLLGTAATLLKESQMIRATSAEARSELAAVRRQSIALRSEARALLDRRKNQIRRYSTTAPADPPPPLLCPDCGRALVHDVSHHGGVNAKLAERWDELSCLGGCGRRFEYRFRTPTLRRIDR